MNDPYNNNPFETDENDITSEAEANRALALEAKRAHRLAAAHRAHAKRISAEILATFKQITDDFIRKL